jgi:hypothetical protein
MMAPHLDRPPSGWHVVTVCRAAARTWDWVASVIDAPPDPDHRRRTWIREAWYRIPGKHRNYSDACSALEAAMATRH